MRIQWIHLLGTHEMNNVLSSDPINGDNCSEPSEVIELRGDCTGVFSS